MVQPIFPFPSQQPSPHRYTAEEVRARLERAKNDGEMTRDSRGIYHQIGASGFSGTPGFCGFSGISGSTPSHNRITYEADVYVKHRKRFSIIVLIREAVNDLKEYFTKKENSHV